MPALKFCITQVNRITNGGDASAVEVLKLMIHLRKVFLEDAVYRRDKYPDFPVYKHRVFSSPSWKIYAQAEKLRVVAREQEWKQKDADLIFKVNELQKGQSTTATVLQGLNDKLEQIVQNGLTVSSSASTGAAEPPTQEESEQAAREVLLPLPPLPKVIADIREFYITWHNCCRHHYAAHKAKYRVFKWKDLGHGDYENHKQRYYRAEPFLSFLDGLDDPESVDDTEIDVSDALGHNVGFGQAVHEALGVMEEFMEECSLSAASLVKTVFYNMVKVDSYISADSRRCSDNLREKLVAAGFDVPVERAKQDQSKKRKAPKDIVTT